MDVILLDFVKAFDTDPHKRLLLKMKTYGINGLVYKWIQAFLNNRRQRIVQGEIVSNKAEIYSGEPQGSVIGPFLYVIFIKDLPELVHNIYKLYADNTKIISRITTDLYTDAPKRS